MSSHPLRRIHHLGVKYTLSDKTLLVNGDTTLDDLKKGDLVITAEIHEVQEVKSPEWIVVTDPGQPYPCIKHLGWGQQAIAKILKGATKSG